MSSRTTPFRVFPLDRSDIVYPNGRVLTPRAKFARNDLNVHDKTASRMNLPTTYIGGVAYVDRYASLEMIGDGVRSRKQPTKQNKTVGRHSNVAV